MQENGSAMKRRTLNRQGTLLRVVASLMLWSPHHDLMTLRVPAEHTQPLPIIVPGSLSRKAAVGRLHISLRQAVSLVTQRLTSVSVDSCARFQFLKIEGQSIAGGSAGVDEYDMIECCSKDGQRTVEGRLAIVSK